MSSASRWASPASAPHKEASQKPLSSSYEAELEDVLGDHQGSAGEDAFQYTGQDSISREDALGDTPVNGHSNNVQEAEAEDEPFDYEAQLADVLEEEPPSLEPIETAAFPKVHASAPADHTQPPSHEPSEAAAANHMQPPASPSEPSQSLSTSAPIPIPIPVPGPSKPPLHKSQSSLSGASPIRRPPLVNAEISRLRSATRRFPSSSSYSSFASEFRNNSYNRRSGTLEEPPESSKFGALSRQSSATNLHDVSVSSHISAEQEASAIVDLEALSYLASNTSLRWNPLRRVSAKVFSSSAPHHGSSLSQQAHKNNTKLLPEANLGQPTCMDASGMICIGTSKGWTLVFDFAQNLKCICGSESISKTCGSVTALSVSLDHTFVAVGHATGSIHLYALNKPSSPARTVQPTNLAAVLSGKAEGHLEGSCIRHIGFVGAKHTSIVSSDDRGLAFYHRLGQVLGLANVDVVRIIGRYPVDQQEADSPPAPLPPLESLLGPGDVTTPFMGNGVNNNNTLLSEAHTSTQDATAKPRPPPVFDVAPLPLGPEAHSTDAYNLVAIITPFKLLVVALKPTPRTLYRVLNKPPTGASTQEADSKTIAALAWLPPSGTSPPSLAFTWGQELRIIKVVEDGMSNGSAKVDAGKSDKAMRSLAFTDETSWPMQEVVLRLLWLNRNTLLTVTPTSVGVWDVNAGVLAGQSSLDLRTILNPEVAVPRSTSEGTSVLAAQNLGTYKGKVFALALADLRVATVLTWADRIIGLVNAGNLVEAIELTTLYYQGQAPNASIGLSDDAETRHDLVAPKLREIMHASIEYVFSEDRLKDGTHVTPNGQGVDRTALFESLVDACIRACLAADDLDFVYTELFDRYQENVIAPIFLRRLEPFILSRTLPSVPTSFITALVDLHEEEGQLEAAEHLIFSVEANELDIDRVLRFARNHDLLDCQIHIETTVLHDWQTPMGRFLQLIDDVETNWQRDQDQYEDQTRWSDAFKLFRFLEMSLTGSNYPSGATLSQVVARESKKQAYGMLFSKTVMTPPGARTPIHTSTPLLSYPYLSLALRFDAEVFFDTLETTLADPYLDQDPCISRQQVLDILQELAVEAEAHNFTTSELALLYIFIERTVDRFPGSIVFSSESRETLSTELIGSCEDAGFDAAIIWHHGANSQPQRALTKFDSVVDGAVSGVWKALQEPSEEDGGADTAGSVQSTVEKLSAATSMSIKICSEQADDSRGELWFSLLSSLVRLTSNFAQASTTPSEHCDPPTMQRLKKQVDAVVPQALSAMFASTSSSSLSFPKLVERLVVDNGNTPFGDFKPILQAITDAYRFEGETLILAKQLIDEDVFRQGAQLRKGMVKGWNAGAARCSVCDQPAWGASIQTTREKSRHDAVNDLMGQMAPPTPRIPRPQDRKQSLKGKESRWTEDLSFSSATPSVSPDDGYRALVVTRAGVVFHKQCYEHGGQEDVSS